MAAIPDDLIDKVALTGPKEAVKERIDAYRDAGRRDAARDPGRRLPGGPAADDQGSGRARCVTAAGAGGPLRVFIGAFGDPGHAFPAIAARQGPRRARGHDVTLETWTRWRHDVEREGMRFCGGARVPGLPHARAAAQALRGGGAGGARDPALDR